MNKTRQQTIRMTAREIEDIAAAIRIAYSGQLSIDGYVGTEPATFEGTLALSTLRQLNKLDLALHALRGQVVREARRGEATWEDIGESLAISKQSAWERWRER